MTKKGFTSLIVYEDDNLLVVNKPAGVPSMPERQKITATSIQEEVRKHYEFAGLCHRLDRETSGALVIAKNAETYRHMSIAFEKRKVNKIYHAIVEGRVQFEHLTIDIPINTNDLHHIRLDKNKGKSAKTHFQTLELFGHYTLMECRPVTGRLHQIRVHLSSQNARIAGDSLYGGKPPLLSYFKKGFKGEDQPIMDRFALHAASIEFTSPAGIDLSISAPYPKDFEVFLKLLRKWDL